MIAPRRVDWVEAAGPEVTSLSILDFYAKGEQDADVSALEAEIDQLVYSLYGLTREDLAIIEESRHEKAGSAEDADDEALGQET
jgi:hypothetical protein